MTDGVVQVAPDSTGKKVDTSELTVGANIVERQRIVIASDTGATALAGVTAANGLAVDVTRVTGTVAVQETSTDNAKQSDFLAQILIELRVISNLLTQQGRAFQDEPDTLRNDLNIIN